MQATRLDARLAILFLAATDLLWACAHPAPPPQPLPKCPELPPVASAEPIPPPVGDSPSPTADPAETAVPPPPTPTAARTRHAVVVPAPEPEPPPVDPLAGAARAAHAALDTLEARRESRGRVILIPSADLFGLGKVVLLSEAAPRLAPIAEVLRSLVNCRIVVEGHTDALGPDYLNDAHSEQRANAVLAFLVEQGLDAARISAVGMGSARPLKEIDAGSAENRRIEIVVTVPDAPTVP